MSKQKQIISIILIIVLLCSFVLQNYSIAVEPAIYSELENKVKKNIQAFIQAEIEIVKSENLNDNDREIYKKVRQRLDQMGYANTSTLVYLDATNDYDFMGKLAQLSPEEMKALEGAAYDYVNQILNLTAESNVPEEVKNDREDVFGELRVTDQEIENAKQTITNKFNQAVNEFKAGKEDASTKEILEYIKKKNLHKIEGYLDSSLTEDLSPSQRQELDDHLNGLLAEYDTTSQILANEKKVHILDTTGFIVDGVLGVLLYPFKIMWFIMPGIVINLLGSGVSKIGGDYDGLLSLDAILFNIFNLEEAAGSPLDTNNAIYKIRVSIANWYYAIRNLSIVIALCVLIYIGIRMATSTLGRRRARYKKLFTDWLVRIYLDFYFALYNYNYN